VPDWGTISLWRVNINGDLRPQELRCSQEVLSRLEVTRPRISLGRGRIELLPITKLKLEFGENLITVSWTAGTARMLPRKAYGQLSTENGLLTRIHASYRCLRYWLPILRPFLALQILTQKDGSRFDERSPGNFSGLQLRFYARSQEDQGARVSIPPSAFAEKIGRYLLAWSGFLAAVTGLNSTGSEFFSHRRFSAVRPDGHDT